MSLDPSASPKRTGSASPSASSSTAAHRDAAAKQIATIPCAILTISDTRTPQTDKGGQLIHELLIAAGHHVIAQTIVQDDATAIRAQLDAWLTQDEQKPEVILATGGTGISSRDTTIEVIEAMLQRPLSGFGELFRMLSWAEIGAAAMLSRATAGLVGETLLFAMPGSTHAVQMAMNKLIIPELPHLVWERRR